MYVCVYIRSECHVNVDGRVTSRETSKVVANNIHVCTYRLWISYQHLTSRETSSLFVSYVRETYVPCKRGRYFFLNLYLCAYTSALNVISYVTETYVERPMSRAKEDQILFDLYLCAYTSALNVISYVRETYVHERPMSLSNVRETYVPCIIRQKDLCHVQTRTCFIHM